MDIPDLRLRGHLLATGLTDSELQRQRRIGALTTIRRGAYVPSGDERLREPAVRHELRVRATVPHLAAASVVSHLSAVVLHRLPVWSVAPERVHVTRDAGGGGRVSRGLHVHAGGRARPGRASRAGAANGRFDQGRVGSSVGSTAAGRSCAPWASSTAG